MGWKQEMQIMTEKSRFWVESICCKGSKMVIFSNFGGLAGDFCKDTFEAKLCGIHIGSVSSGLDAENGNTDAAQPSRSRPRSRPRSRLRSRPRSRRRSGGAAGV